MTMWGVLKCALVRDMRAPMTTCLDALRDGPHLRSDTGSDKLVFKDGMRDDRKRR